MSRFVLPAFILSFALPCIVLAQEAMVQGRTVKEWTQGLKHFDPRIRFWSLQALGEAGSDAASASPTLVKLLKDPYPQIRRESAKLLSALGGDAADAALALAAALGDVDAGVRQHAAQALSGLGEKATPALIEALKSKDSAPRLGALGALEAMQPTLELVQAVAATAKDGTSIAVRRASVAVLVKFGSMEPEAQEALVGALRDKEPTIRHTAAVGLVAMGKDSQPHFVKAYGDTNPSVRLTCLQGLSQLGDDLDPATILLFAKALDDADGKVRYQAASSLGVATNARELGGGAKLAEKLFERSLGDKEASVRRAAVWALGKIGVDSPEELRKLGQSLKDADIYTRGLTVQSLGQYLHEETPVEWRDVIIGQLTEAAERRDVARAGRGSGVCSIRGPSALRSTYETGGKQRRIDPYVRHYLLGEISAPAAAAIPPWKMSRDAPPDARASLSKRLRENQILTVKFCPAFALLCRGNLRNLRHASACHG
ncbi:MAG: HEAT repeat domain-containing protein [Gemmataceae bacterium]